MGGASRRGGERHEAYIGKKTSDTREIAAPSEDTQLGYSWLPVGGAREWRGRTMVQLLEKKNPSRNHFCTITYRLVTRYYSQVGGKERPIRKSTGSAGGKVSMLNVSGDIFLVE